jgi:hypothetical protein
MRAKPRRLPEIAETFAMVPTRALDDPTLRQADLCVLLAIASYAHADGGRCWANAKTIATRAHVSQNYFWKSAKRLLEAGLIEREQSGQGAGKSSCYSIVWARKGTTLSVVGSEEITASATTPSDVGAPHEPSRRRDTHEGTGRNTERGGTTINKPSSRQCEVDNSMQPSTLACDEDLTTQEGRKRARRQLTEMYEQDRRRVASAR